MNRLPLLALPLAMLTACSMVLTLQEAKDAMAESTETARVDAFSGSVTEITTDFTLGQAAEEAAEELRAFVQSQIPCSTVTREGTTVTMDFGTLDDACVWNGRTYAGVTSVTLVSAEPGHAEVLHEWVGMTDGELTMDGEATVTWDAEDASRHVVHEVAWTNAAGEARTGTGDRTQTLLDADQGISAGIEVNGSRAWTAPAGEWQLDIDGVQMRGQDPVPQAGTYTLWLPNGKDATLTFTRLDEGTIEVVLAGGQREHTWHVTAAGSEYQES